MSIITPNNTQSSIKEYNMVKLDYANWSQVMYIVWNWDETVTAFTKPRADSPSGFLFTKVFRHKLEKWFRKRRLRQGMPATVPPVLVASQLILSGRHHTIDATMYPVYLRLFVQHRFQWQTRQFRLFDEQYDLVMFSPSDHRGRATKKQQEPACVRLDRRQHICVSKECFMGVGAFHFLVTDQGGWKVYGDGDNQYGQLGFSVDTEERQSTIDLINREAVDLKTELRRDEEANETGGPSNQLEKEAEKQRRKKGKEKVPICTKGRCLQQSDFTPESPVAQIACGGFHSALRCEDGSVWTCGRNHHGQLGLNINSDRDRFSRVSLDIPCVQIACGYAHSAALCRDGSLWLWGRYDFFGAHGSSKDPENDNFNADEDYQRSYILYKPKRIDLLDGKAGAVLCIDCGPYHTVALMEDGTVVGFGMGDMGQLGQGPIYNTALTPSILHSPGRSAAHPIFVAACAFSTIIVFDNKSILSFPPKAYIPSPVKSVVQVPPDITSHKNRLGQFFSLLKRRLRLPRNS
jgi:hypothetical protein